MSANERDSSASQSGGVKCVTGGLQPALRMILIQIGVAAAYWLLARVVLQYFSDSIATVLWLPSGLALATLLLGGPRYAWGVWLGALLAHLGADGLWWTAVLIALGNTLSALAGVWLLKRRGNFDLGLPTSHDYGRLILWGGCIPALIGTAVGPTVLLVAGIFRLENFPNEMLHWWMGDVLGVVLLTPLILVWRNFPEDWRGWPRLTEAALLLGCVFVAGQVIFLGWAHDTSDFIARSFLMFLFVVWAAARLGMHGVMLVLVLITAQALLGAYQHVGVFGDDLERSQLVNLWLYIVTLSLVGMMLASFIGAERREKRALAR